MYKPLQMHQFVHTLSFLSGGDTPKGPAKEYLSKIRHRLFSRNGGEQRQELTRF